MSQSSIQFKTFNATDICINDISPIISTDLFKVLKTDFLDILGSICDKHSLDYNSVLNDYSLKISKLGTKYGIKQRNRRKLNPENTCMGRKGDGKQCTRGRRTGSDYCKSHENNLPEGRIDELYTKKNKNRGRKKTNKTNEYINTKLELIDNVNYLVDENNYIYSYNMNNPEFLGIKLNGKLHKIEVN